MQINIFSSWKQLIVINDDDDNDVLEYQTKKKKANYFNRTIKYNADELTFAVGMLLFFLLSYDKERV